MLLPELHQYVKDPVPSLEGAEIFHCHRRKVLIRKYKNIFLENYMVDNLGLTGTARTEAAV
jgi:hypothetical protein